MTSFVAAVQDAERAQTIADLRAARAELVRRGWTKDAFVDPEEGRVCALGAIGAASVEGFMLMTYDDQSNALVDLRPDRVIAVLTAKLHELHPNREVEVFNDDRETTYQDVLDLFDKTLAELGGLG